MERLKEAMFYEKAKDGRVICQLCPHFCSIAPDETGFCRVRKNIGGILYALNYGKITAYAMDPIEKKPLANYHPGSRIFSIGSFGCNLKCVYCQNYCIAHEKSDGIYTTSDNIADIANEEENNLGIAFTYNEPFIWYEFVKETAEKNAQKGSKNVLVTNGYVNREPLMALIDVIDAMNIDLKAFSESDYKKWFGGTLQPVLDTIKASSSRCHVEITTLLATGIIDDADTVERIAKWIASINDGITLHLTRYFPCYRHNKPATDIEFMKRAQISAMKYLKNVYLGNAAV